MLDISFSFSKSSTIAGPNPSIFIASFEAKCSIERESCAGQALFVQRVAASSSRKTFSPQEGHTEGI